MQNPPPYEEKNGMEPSHIPQQQYSQPQQQYPNPQQQYPNPQQQYPPPQQQYFQPQQQAGYGYNQGPQVAPQPMVNAPIQNNINVNAAAPASNTVIIQGQVRPSSYMGLACCVIWCCNPLVGIIAFVFSLLSSSAADENDIPRARTMGRLSMWFSIAGMIITVVLVGVIVGLAVNKVNNENPYGYK